MAHEQMTTEIGHRNVTVQSGRNTPVVWLEIETEDGSNTTIVALTGEESTVLGRKLIGHGIAAGMIAHNEVAGMLEMLLER